VSNKNKNLKSILYKYILFIFIFTIPLAAMQDSQNGQVKPLKQLIVNNIVKSIKESVKENLHKKPEDIEDIINLKWLNPDKLPLDLINDIKDEISSQVSSVTLFQKSIQVFKIENLNSVEILLNLSDSRIAIAGHYDSLAICDIKNNKLINTQSRCYGKVIALAELSDKNIISSHEYGRINIWDYNTGNLIKTFGIDNESIRCMKLLSDTNIITGGLDNSIKIWDIQTGKCIKILQGHNHGVISIETFKDRKVIASGSYDKAIRLWDYDGNCKKVLEGHTGAILHTIALSDNMLLSSAWDGTLRVWDIDSGKCIHVLKLSEIGSNSRPYIYDIKILKNNIIAVPTYNDVQVWDAIKGERIAILKGHEDLIYSIIELDNNIIASCSPDGTIRVWDINQSKCINTIINNKKSIWRLRFHKDNLIIAGTSSGSIYVYKPGINFQDKLLELGKVDIYSDSIQESETQETEVRDCIIS